jgi:hypothetical protein
MCLNFADALIGACDQQLNFCVRLISLEHEWQDTVLTRHNLVLHPYRGLMFWIETLSKSNVYMANMKGINKESV